MAPIWVGAFGLVAVLVAIYTRVSREDAEEPQSTRRQERACREFARSKGWEIRRVYEDVDVSAYDRRVQRPAYAELLRDVAGGKVNGVLVWKLDRLARRSSDFEQFWDRCERAGVFLVSATEPIDSGNEIGLAVIRILINFANVESTSISLRVSAKAKERAASGIPSWPGRAFGFDLTATSIVEAEADLIREAARRVLDGEPVAAITRDWRRRRVPPGNGTKPWLTCRLTRILENHRLVGDNEFRGVVVAKDCFPPILDRLTHSRVRAALAGRRRQPGSRAKQSVLSGLLRCGVCGSKLHQTWTYHLSASGEKDRYRLYRCSVAGCGSVCINADFTERLITEAVICRIESRRPTAEYDLPDDASDRLKAAFDRFTTSATELSNDYFVHGRMTRQEWVDARNGLERQLQVARQHLDPAWQSPVRLRDGPAVSFRAEWPTLSTSHRRDIIASELDSAHVHPTRQKAFFDARRVEPRWRDQVDVPGTDYPWPRSGSSRQRPWLDPEVMLADEVAELLGMNVQRVRQRALNGELHATKVGHHWRYDRAEIEDYARKVKESIGVAQVAEMLGVTAKGVNFWISKGRIPAVLSANRYHFQPEELKIWGQELRRLVATKEAAEMLGVTRYWLKRLIQAGDIHALSNSRGAQFVDRDEVAALLHYRPENCGSSAVVPQAPYGRRSSKTMSLRQVATAIRCGPGTLRKLVFDGKLPTVTKAPNGYYLFSEADFRRAQRLVASKKARGPMAARHPRGPQLPLGAGPAISSQAGRTLSLSKPQMHDSLWLPSLKTRIAPLVDQEQLHLDLVSVEETSTCSHRLGY